MIRSSIFLQNSLVLFAGTMLANILNYVFHFAMGRMVEPAVYGEMESIVSLLTIVTVPGTAIALIATRYAATAKARNDIDLSINLFRKLNKKIFLYGFPFFLLALLTTPWVAQFLKVEHEMAIVFLWTMMFLSFFGSVATGMLNGWQKFFWVGGVNVVSSFTKLFSATLLVFLGFAVDGIVGAFLLSSLIGYGVSLWVLGRMKKKHEQDVPKKALVQEEGEKTSFRAYALPVLFASLAIALLGNIDMVLAKYHLDPDQAGSYGALFIVSKTIFFFAGILTAVMFSMSAEEHEKNGKKENHQSSVFRKSFTLISIFCFLSVVFFVLFPKFVLGVFFGETYLHASSYLGWFALASALYTLVHFLSQYLLSIGRTGIAWAMLFVALLEIPILFFLGEDIMSIIVFVIIFQSITLLLGGAFIWKNRYKQVS